MINAWRDRESSSNFTVLQPTGTKEIACRRKYHKDFVAFDDISFEVKNGETPGIIGLKWCGEVKAFFRSSPVFAIPDKGTIQIDDKVTGLLEPGNGFNAEMTGLREHLHERHPYRHVKGRARPGKSRRSSTSPSSAISSTNPSRPIRPG